MRQSRAGVCRRRRRRRRDDDALTLGPSFKSKSLTFGDTVGFATYYSCYAFRFGFRFTLRSSSRSWYRRCDDDDDDTNLARWRAIGRIGRARRLAGWICVADAKELWI